MTRPRRHSVARTANPLGLTLVLSLSACSALTPPSAQTIAIAAAGEVYKLASVAD
jgi:hypothetical protein